MNDPVADGVRTVVRAAGGTIQPAAPLADLKALLADPGALVWVDIAVDGREQGDRILDGIFGFHHLTIDDCYNTLIDPPKVDDYGDYLFVIIHDVRYDHEARALATSELDIYIGKNYVVSVHRSPVRAIEDVRRRAEENSIVLQRGPAFLAHALIDGVVDDFQPVVEEISEHLETIEERVIDVPERQTLQELLQLKRNAMRLRRSISPQRDIINRFARSEYPHLVPDETIMYFRDIYDHTVRVNEAIESVRDLADSALNTYLSSVNNRTNEVMKTLAIVTAIFLPLTLIAGIYGTNFANVPEYQWRYAYASMWIVMGVIVVALVAWFRYRRWF